VSPLLIVLTIFTLIIIVPLLASFLMAIILESANHEGIYDDLDQDS
jgi:hypothetical protein